ncbi:hypothetical protein B0H11DRAFT_2258773 [Mycena galericulata]|nr:hypothetical protein B0H11DRAFT_2258773 [Mycena galericulata]
MARISRDPSADSCPDFSDAAFSFLRNAFITADPTKSQANAVADMSAAWTANWNSLKAAWDTQEAADQIERDDGEKLARENARLAQEKKDAELEEEGREVEKKRPKQKEFNGARRVGDAITPRASAFALEKLKHFKYCEIWYFTQEGTADAAEHHRAVADDAFGLAKTEEGMALRPLASSRPSRNVVKDKDLMWRQFNIGKNTMLTAMQKFGWSPASLQSLAAFWLNLELHPQRSKPHGEQILLAYQARVRLEWHDTLDAGDEGFDVADINETLMWSMADDVWDEVRAEGLRQVSDPLLYALFFGTMFLTFCPSPSFPLSPPFSPTCFPTCFPRHASPHHASQHASLHDMSVLAMLRTMLPDMLPPPCFICSHSAELEAESEQRSEQRRQVTWARSKPFAFTS